MEQRCEIILQNYLKTHEYNNDYKIIDNNDFFTITYKNNILFKVFKIDVNCYMYIKYNIFNNYMEKKYNHKNYSYYMNMNNKIIYYREYMYTNKLIKFIINNNKECKYYNFFFKIYSKIFENYSKNINFMYYYSNSYIYCSKQIFNLDNAQYLKYSIMFLLYIIL